MHGELRLGIRTEALKIESKWTGLSNPELDPSQVEGGEEGIRDHPSTRMKQKKGEEGWAVVRVDGRDWGRVLGVGRLGGKVIACRLTDNIFESVKTGGGMFTDILMFDSRLLP